MKNLKFGANFATKKGQAFTNTGIYQMFWLYDPTITVGANKVAVQVHRLGAGTVEDPYTYSFQCANRTLLVSLIGSGDLVITDSALSVNSFLEDLASYVDAGYNVPLASVDNSPLTQAQLFAFDGTTSPRTIKGSGINVDAILGLSGGNTLSIGGNPVGQGTIEPNLTDAEKATLAEIAKEKTRKAGTLGFVSSWKGTDTTGFAYKFGSWVQDNPILFLLAGLIGWNFVIQPNFFPTTTMFTFGDTKQKALDLIEASKKKTNSVRRRVSNFVKSKSGKNKNKK
jgi:hypothetical protein